MFSKLNSELELREADKIFDLNAWKKALAKLVTPEIFDLEKSHINFNKLNQELISLSKSCNDNGVVFSLHAHLWGAVFPLLKFGNKEQKNKYLKPLAIGDMIGALVYTDSKTDPLIYKKNPNGSFTLNGKKRFITNAPVADVFIVYARDIENQLTAFLISKDNKGLGLTKSKNLIGFKTSPISDISFIECEVDGNSILGAGEGVGSFVFNSSIEKERLFIMSSLLGRLYFLKNVYLENAKKNKLLDYFPNQEVLANLENAIFISNCLLEDSVRTLERGENVFLKAAQSKTIITSLYQEVTRSVIQSLGAIGLEVEIGLERELRDSIASTIYSGTNEILKKIIASTAKI